MAIEKNAAANTLWNLSNLLFEKARTYNLAALIRFRVGKAFGTEPERLLPPLQGTAVA